MFIFLESQGYQRNLTLNPFVSSAQEILQSQAKRGRKHIPPGKTTLNLNPDDRKELEEKVRLFFSTLLNFIMLLLDWRSQRAISNG